MPNPLIPFVNRMAVMHTLSPTRLKEMKELGWKGMPSPSLAVMRPARRSPFDFGDVGLVGRPHLAEPSETNPIHASDIFSPRVPTINQDPERPTTRYFTRQGRSPSGSVLLDRVPPTLENVVEHMRSQPLIGGEYGAAGAFNPRTPTFNSYRALTAPRFNTMQDLLGARSGLASTEHEYMGAQERNRSEHDLLASKLFPHRADPTQFGRASDMLAAAMLDRSRNGGANFDQFYRGVPDELMERLNAHQTRMDTAPELFYEAKPQRAVGMDEFAGALVPQHMEKELTPLLRDQGVSNIVPYSYHGSDESKANAVTENFGENLFARGGRARFGGGGSAVKNAMRMIEGLAHEAPGGVKAYHFSPHSFDRFETSHPGSGAGGTSFGHGLYFGAKEDDARMWQRRVNEERGQPRDAGHMYETQLNFDPNRVIDYNKYLHEQPQEVQDILRNKLGFEPQQFLKPEEGGWGVGAPRGDMAVPRSAGAAAAWSDAGIQGVKYYDPNNSYSGYVSFSADPVSVLRKYERGGRAPRAGGGKAVRSALRMLGQLYPEGAPGFEAVKHMPETIKLPGIGRVQSRPIEPIQGVANEYMRARGLGAKPLEFVPINPEYSKRVAGAYADMPHDPRDPAVKRSYDALIEETMDQLRAAKPLGIKYQFIKPGQSDPYALSPALGYADLLKNRRLSVFPTEAGFGTLNEAGADNPLLRPVGRIGDLRDATANDAFRIVHDLYGHYGPGNAFFRGPGEENAFQLHSRMYSPEALPAAASETRGQNSWVNFGPHAEQNATASGADTVYADQKTGIMPAWAYQLPPEEGADVDAYIKGFASGGRARLGAGGDVVKKALRIISRGDTPLAKAAQGLGSTTTREDYHALVNDLKPVRPYESVPTPATTEEMLAALHANKRPKVGLGNQIAEGQPVGLRLDIPAYTEHNTWVPTIHDTANNNRVLAHEGAAHVTNPVFDMSQSKALKVAQGGPKNPFATINGGWRPTTPEEAHALAQDALNHPDWRQVGMDPERHSYFYDRHTQEPIVSAEEAVQVGPLVLAKKPVYGNREDYNYSHGGHVERAMRTIRRGFEDGGMPGDDASAFVQEQLHPAPQPSALVDQMSGPTAAAVMETDRDRPMSDASEFVRHQLGKTTDPQLPQMDREAYDAMKYGAVDALHNLAYFSPAAPAAGAYDLYKGLESGDPTEVAASSLGLPGRAAKAGAMALSALMPGEAQAGPIDSALKIARRFVKNPTRVVRPEIYTMSPSEMADIAESRVAPESPALKRLFGVTRGEMNEIAGSRAGTAEPSIVTKANARGSDASKGVMTPRNAQRLVDILDEANKRPGLSTGMRPWYYMDPAYNRMVDLLGPDAAEKEYHRLNTTLGVHSPGAPVPTEINRGLGAYYFGTHGNNYGNIDDYIRYAGNPATAPAAFQGAAPGLQGHPYHSTSHGKPLGKFYGTGEHGMKSPKVPLYIQASGSPRAFQTTRAVPDAHYTRLVGLPDTRGGATKASYDASMSMPEYQDIGPWWEKKVAKPAGMEAVPAQALAWGAGSHLTGVDTPIGAPKLELLANHIMQRAAHHGISPENARDLILQGKLYNRGGKVKGALRLAHKLASKG